MIDVSTRCRASIRSVGLAPWWLWVIAKLGEEKAVEVVDGYHVRYVQWRGLLYTVVDRKDGP